MTTFNTDYSNTELLDQELTIEQLEAVAGGGNEPKDVLQLPFLPIKVPIVERSKGEWVLSIAELAR